MGDARRQHHRLVPARGALELGIRRQWPENTVIPLSIGFLGGYTTFSTFSYETVTLARADRAPEAMVYLAVSVVAGVLAAGTGYWVARRPETSLSRSTRHYVGTSSDL